MADQIARVRTPSASTSATARRSWPARRSRPSRRRRPCASCDGQTITTDGPFAETKETLGGFYLVEAADLDEAIAYAAMIPGAPRSARSRSGRSGSYGTATAVPATPAAATAGD